MYDWTDVRFLLAVARAGSSIGAARATGVDASTVQRRLAALERSLDVRLVERRPEGYRLTAAGRAVLPAAEALAAAADAFRTAAGDAGGAAVLRLTCPEPIAARLVAAGLIDRFHAGHPGLHVEFVLADHYVDLVRGEADVALRSGHDDGALVGRTVAESLWAVYASRDRVAAHGGPAGPTDLAAHPLVGLDAAHAGHRLSTWLHAVAPEAVYAARAESVLGLVSAAKAGLGVAALPLALGDAEPDLVRLFGPVAALTRPWRLLARRDARALPKVAAFFAFVANERAALRPVLTG